MLRLLAMATGLEGYTAPSEALAEALAATTAGPGPEQRQDARRAEVMAFITAAGGEAG